MILDKDILNAIETIARRLARRHWSESAEDLVQDGVVLALELYAKNPKADKEWIYKALHNMYSTKAKKMRRYEYNRSDESHIERMSYDDEEEEERELDDIDLEIVGYLLKQGMKKGDILKHMNLSERTMYSKIAKSRKES